MKPQHIHQEVLIFTNTTLSQKALCGKNNGNKSGFSMEELEEAIWDGLLNELAPEIRVLLIRPKMFIWAIHAGEFYLLIDLADSPGIPESILSIDPDLFLCEINMN